MKTISVSSLRPGLTFTEPVYIDDINLLVPAHIAVRKKDIQQLVSWGIETVTTDGDVVIPSQNDKPSIRPGSVGRRPEAPINPSMLTRGAERRIVGVNITGEGNPIPQTKYKTPVPHSAPPMAASIRQAAPAGGNVRPVAPAGGNIGQVTPAAASVQKKTVSLLSLKEVRENQEDYKIYLKLIGDLDTVFKAYTEQKAIPLQFIETIANRLLATVHTQKSQLVGFVLSGKMEGRALARSSVNSAILAARTAMALKLLPNKILQVISGSLLHDIGMLKLPKNVQERRGELSAGELQLIHAHPLASYKIICKELGFPNDSGIIAYQHHERWDGRGYPKKLAGTSIDLCARIVAMADAFESLVSEKPHRTSMEGALAVKALFADNGRRFDPEVLKAFIIAMRIYPVGSFVKLNNNAICQVLSVEGSAPLRPKVGVLIDENDRTFRPGEGKEYSLNQEKSLFILYALNPKEIVKHS
jgi:HD-GYP domain-containing protein (c-di-GMP phosphodiesterase class II)